MGEVVRFDPVGDNRLLEIRAPKEIARYIARKGFVSDWGSQWYQGSSLSMEPSGPRSAEAMLAIANCQVELKDNAAARKTLDDLVKRFPTSEAAQAAKDRLARLK